MKTMREQHPQKRVNSRKNKKCYQQIHFCFGNPETVGRDSFPALFLYWLLHHHGGWGRYLPHDRDCNFQVSFHKVFDDHEIKGTEERKAVGR